MIRNRKVAPFYTGVFDDTVFTYYEYKNFVQRAKTSVNAKSNDLENELCKKWNSISIGTTDEPRAKFARNDFHSSASNSNESSFMDNEFTENKSSGVVILANTFNCAGSIPIFEFRT